MSVGKETWGRLSPLLDELLDLPDDDRDARLAALRAEDPNIAQAVAAMLGHLPAIERGEFMPSAAMPKPGGLAGQAIGPYALVREIGHGGMGTVWLARRTDGRYEGEVAIKFLRSGLFGHGDAARFQREGSILARLSHPNIARLLDAGVMADGAQPYLVLEYIDGEPIDQYCHRLALSVEARLRLMLDVLAAVAQAHNRLILHRDLKPTNILVNKAGEVKLLDFGIAKLLDDASAGQTALTVHAGNAFTPEFAAPEQVQAGDVTTATDVYALGVLMYILLGGDHPTAAPTGAPLDRMRSVIETEPRRLSEAVLKRGGPTQRWSPESRRLALEVRGDIETIVAKALKKSPSERYANADALADDIRRYLAHEPIAARPDSRLYRAAKFVQRHRAGVAATSLAIAALGVGIGVALWQAREAQAQRVQAEGLIEYMIGDLRKKLQPVGRLDVLDGVGLKALDYYAGQDLNRLDADSLGRRARALHMIGDLAQQRGKFEEAVRDFQQAADTTSQ
ncbi:MAG: serine/threonine protein kinase, partial [Burkholderiales bacterium]|nr:serine/threonine protein kinase [Burkholderiales bacterium]